MDASTLVFSNTVVSALDGGSIGAGFASAAEGAVDDLLQSPWLRLALAACIQLEIDAELPGVAAEPKLSRFFGAIDTRGGGLAARP